MSIVRGAQVTEPKLPKLVGLIPCFAGTLLWALICFGKAEGPVSGFLVGMFAFALVPYAFCALVALVGKGHPCYALAGSLAALAWDALTYHSVFVSPSSSTATLGLLFAPLGNVLFFVPGGMLAAYLVQRARIGVGAP